jgi:hypothetical protein
MTLHFFTVSVIPDITIEEVYKRKIRTYQWPWNWAPLSDPSIRKLDIVSRTYHVTEIWRHTFLLEDEALGFCCLWETQIFS